VISIVLGVRTISSLSEFNFQFSRHVANNELKQECLLYMRLALVKSFKESKIGLTKRRWFLLMITFSLRAS